MLVCGYDIESSRRAIQLTHGKGGLFASCGIHPHSASSLTPRSLVTLRQLAKDVVAVGEIGLDFYRDLSPRSIQIDAFSAQAHLARDVGLPIIVHVRKAFSTAISVLKQLGGTHSGVMHCFSGDLADAEEAVNLGLHVSFSGSVTFNSPRLEHAARCIPENKLLIETDAPYLAPAPYRGRRNEPAYLTKICDRIAHLRNITYEDAARVTTANGRLVFLGELPPPSLAYRLGDSLYLNVTNQCTNRCSFCIRAKTPLLRGYNLRLEREPAEHELIDAVGNLTGIKEVVFCGYGEPLIRLELVKKVATYLKAKGAYTRVNTNGEGNLIHGRNIVPEIANVVDAISISLNAESREKYLELCSPQFGMSTYDSILDFTREATKQIARVILTVVALPGVDIEQCRNIARHLGCEFKVRRPFD